MPSLLQISESYDRVVLAGKQSNRVMGDLVDIG